MFLNLFERGVIISKKGSKTSLIIIYGNICFLGGEISKKNILTYHHLDPYGGETVENGALLGRLQHDIFNRIESYNKFIANELNAGFIDYKRTKDLALILQMKSFVDKWVIDNGYEIVKNHKCFELKKEVRVKTFSFNYISCCSCDFSYNCFVLPYKFV